MLQSVRQPLINNLVDRAAQLAYINNMKLGLESRLLRQNPLLYYGRGMKLVENGAFIIHFYMASRFEYKAITKHIRSTRDPTRFHIVNLGIDEDWWDDDLIDGMEDLPASFDVYVLDNYQEIIDFSKTLPIRSVEFQIKKSVIERAEQHCLRKTNYALFRVIKLHSEEISHMMSIASGHDRELVEFMLRI
jgi:hypothetical protein